MLSLEEKKKLIVFFTFFSASALLMVGYFEGKKKRFFYEGIKPVLSPTSRECVECHKRKGFSPVSFNTWQKSIHAVQAIGCADCHIPAEGSSEKILKEKTSCEVKSVRRKVPSQNCRTCHSEEGKEFDRGLHGGDHRRAHLLLNFSQQEKKNCILCHGVSEEGGRCNDCHFSHTFDPALSRSPNGCITCHRGKYHPQFDSYENSLHFSTLNASQFTLPLKEAFENPFMDNSPDSPSCAYCHHKRLSPYGVFFAGLNTFNGERLRELLRKNLSKDLFQIAKSTWTEGEEYEERIKGMKERCKNCHGETFVEESVKEMGESLDRALKKFLEEIRKPFSFPDLIKMSEETEYLPVFNFLKESFATVHLSRERERE